MTAEHSRLLAITGKAYESATIKPTDRILVIAANKEGVWVSSGNTGAGTLQMLENICKELRANSKSEPNY